MVAQVIPWRSPAVRDRHPQLGFFVSVALILIIVVSGILDLNLIEFAMIWYYQSC